MLFSYHHVLKSMGLEGKRNRCANHLVHTLVIDMLPHYQACHDGQEVGFNGSNLAQKRHKEILVRTLEMNADSIRILGDNCYYMQSEADTSREYLVGLSEQSCDCLDWPRVQLCKHITAVAHFFENGNQLVELAADTGATPKTVQPVESEHPPDVRRDSTVASILENVINVSKEFLSDGVPKSLGTVWSLHSVEEHLTPIVQNSRSLESLLPDKEAIPPNQHTWTETAQRMGAQRWKRPRPTTTSSPEPTATERIGDLNRKQPRVRITDPYSGREWRRACSLTALEKRPQACGHSSPICPPVPLPPPVVPAFFGSSPTCLSASRMVHSLCHAQRTDRSAQHWSICLRCRSQRPREFSPTVLCTTPHARGYPSPICTPAIIGPPCVVPRAHRLPPWNVHANPVSSTISYILAQWSFPYPPASHLIEYLDTMLYYSTLGNN